MLQTTKGRNRWVGKLAAVACIAVLAGACDDDPAGPDPIVYEGEVEGVGDFSELNGEVAFEATATTVDISVSLADYPDQGDGFPWILREGTCATPGDALGELDDYPLIELDEEGVWGDEVTASIDDDEDSYVFELRRSAEDDETVIACGDLSRI